MENNSNSLAKISLGINVILIIAVIVLFMKSPGGASEANTEDDVDTTDLTMLSEKGETAVIVYYNADSLNAKSGFVKELQNDIMQAQKDAEDKMIAKDNEIRRWEKKWADKQPLLNSEKEQYMQEAQQKQNEMMVFQQELEQKLMQTQTELTIAGINRISLYARELALKNGYDFILQYTIGQNIIYVNPKMDITDELLEIMNNDYFGEEGTSDDNEADADAGE